MSRRWKCLDYPARIRLEALLKAGHSKREIAALLGCHLSTVYRELKRGACVQLDYEYRYYGAYSPEIAQRLHEWRVTSRGAPVKLGHNTALVDCVEGLIIGRGYSPAAAAAALRRSPHGYLCRDTIYRYIDQGFFPRLTRAHLPFGHYQTHPHKQVLRTPRYGRSIEDRPPEVEARAELGHWEMDTVHGKEGTVPACLVLSERMTRAEIVIKLPNLRSSSVNRALRRLLRGADPRLFKTITSDNGSEFAALPVIRSISDRVYYCHPYRPSERGTNENCNRLVRRWYPKGTSFADVSPAKLQELTRWINDYPRGVLGWKSASEVFRAACAAEGISIPQNFSHYFS